MSSSGCRGVQSVKLGAFSSPIGKMREGLKHDCSGTGHQTEAEAEADLETVADDYKMAGN